MAIPAAPPRVKKKSARRKKLEAAILYPIDWLEERSGLISRGTHRQTRPWGT